MKKILTILFILFSSSASAQYTKVDTVKHHYQFKSLLEADMKKNNYEYFSLEKTPLAQPYVHSIKISPKRSLNFQVATRIRLVYFKSWKRFKKGINRTAHHLNLILPRPI